MATKNIVLEGKYKGIKIRGGSISLCIIDTIGINKQSVKSYTVIDE